MPFRERTGGDDDDVLMARYAQGDVAAFEELYQRYESRLYGFSLRYLGDPDAAADAFQETFIRVIEARNSYEPRGRFASWLFTIARRVCVDQLRLAKRKASVEAMPDQSESLIAPAGSVEERLAHQDEVQQLLALLPAEQREVLLLSKYHGFTYSEIAEMVGSSEVAVKQKAYRALKTLRAHTVPGTE